MARSDRRKRCFSSTVVARILDISVATVGRWAKAKILPPHVGVGVHRRWPRESIIQFARDNGFPLPSEQEEAE
jgi:hypothetical protein